MDTNFALAKLHNKKGDGRKAQRLFQTVMKGYREMGCRRGIAETLLAVSKDLKGSSDQREQLVNQMKEAMEIFEEFGNVARVEECEALLSSLDSHVG